MSRITTRRFALWWSLAQTWLNNKFSGITIDTSTLAKEATLGTPALGQASTIFGAIAGIPQVTGYALQGDNSNATNTQIDGKIGTSADTSASATIFGKIADVKSAIPTEAQMKNLYAARAEANQDGTDTYTIVLPYTAQVTETATDIEITI